MNTPLLQITRAYCALANGGKMPQLRLIDRTSNVDGSGEVTEPYAPQVQLFERKEAHEQLVDMLATVTETGGTATRAAIPGYKVAGKTGTSRKGYSKKGFSGFYYTSFAGFVPAKDPKIVMTIMVDSPKGRRPGGGSVAAPVFARAAERILKYMNVPADPELLSKKRR
jgi:cell division protein FtsI/penicillin-binding protein 2